MLARQRCNPMILNLECECLDCASGYHHLMGDGFCNDEINNAACNYDGGDCCGYNFNSTYCSECLCHIPETCAAGYHPFVEDGFCNDETNNAACNYDDGDCCGYNVNNSECSECLCHVIQTCAVGYHPLGKNLCLSALRHINH